MPELCRFFGIIIQMYGNDHEPPHFHVIYNEYRAIIEIETGEILQGVSHQNNLNLFRYGQAYMQMNCSITLIC